MQKTYWWRITTLLFSGSIVFLGWIYETFFCFSYSDNCLLDQYRLSFFEPTILLFLSLSITSFFLFFVDDAIFLKWLRLTIVWFVLAMIIILFVPVYSGGWGANLNPTKESVSIWMGTLFVIISLVLIAREKWKIQ